MKISHQKRERIVEQILLYLYNTFPKQPFTAEIAREIARDEEFIKKILYDLNEKNLITSIKKNKKGISFSRRVKWTLTKKVYDLYHSKQG